MYVRKPIKKFTALVRMKNSLSLEKRRTLFKAFIESQCKYLRYEKLKEQILTCDSVPVNLDKVRNLDDFLKDLLKEKHKNYELNTEEVLEKLQRKTVDIMGPLSKFWHILETVKNSNEENVEISIKELCHFLDQSVILTMPLHITGD